MTKLIPVFDPVIALPVLSPHYRHFTPSTNDWIIPQGNKEVLDGILSSLPNAKIVRAARFIYYARLEHKHLESVGGCTAGIPFQPGNLYALKVNSFDIPKIRDGQHYVECIRLFENADGYKTEASQWLQIVYAKVSY